MTYLSLLIISAIITYTSCFTIQGNWSLIANGQNPQGPPITLQISDFVYKNTTILQKLTFSGCETMLLQAEFTENQLFINAESYYTQPINGYNCSSLQNNPLDSIFQSLATVFYFQIQLNVLSFNDPWGSTIVSFRRVLNTHPTNLTGIWSMNQYGNTRTALSVQITPTQITLCQGYSVYNYSFPPARNTIKLTAVTDKCPSPQLSQAVQQVVYYRVNNGILDMYDGNVSLIIEMVYSNAYDPSKPIFAAASSAPASNPGPAASSGFSVSNIAGNWSILTLFNLSFPNSPYYLTITAATITLNGGCNTYSYPYTITPSTQLITLGNATATTNSCGQSDDQLYASGVIKMFKYLTSTSGNTNSLVFYDQTGNSGFSLYQKIAQAVKPVTGSPATQPSGPFAPGLVLMLLLQRRDLPRALVNLTSTSLTYTLCNTIVQNYKIGSPLATQGNITVSGGPTTKNSCSSSNDQLYYSTMNSAVSYTYDAPSNSITFKNSAGKEVVTLSHAS